VWNKIATYYGPLLQSETQFLAPCIDKGKGKVHPRTDNESPDEEVDV
jgi:hypothetical protein